MGKFYLSFREAGRLSLVVFLTSIGFASFAQTTTINYATSSLSTSACNVFSASPTVGGKVHVSVAGGVTFGGSTGITLYTTPASSGSPAGTAFAIDYSFITGDHYTIAITTNGGDGSVNLFATLTTSLSPQFPAVGPGECSPDPDVQGYQEGGIGAAEFPLIGFGSTTHTVSSFTPSASQSMLVIWASGGNDDLESFNISEIVITQTTPPPTCSLVAASGLTTTNNGTTLNWSTLAGASSYNIVVNDAGTIHTLSSNTNSVAFCPAANGDLVSFTVQGVCSNGVAGATSTAHSYTYTAPTLTVPTGVMFNSAPPYTVSWTPVTGAIGYYYSVTHGAPVFVSGTSISDPDAELSFGESTNVQVAAVFPCGMSAFSTPLPVTMPSGAPPTCSAPSVAVVESGTFVILYPVTGAVSYNIGYENSSGTIVFTDDNLSTSVTTSGVTVTGVPPGSYYVVGQANCSNGLTSAWGPRYFNELQTVTSVKRPLDSLELRALASGASGDSSTWLLVYPNPSHSLVNMVYHTNQTGSADISVTTTFGNTILHKMVSTVGGQNNYSLDIGSLANGIYILKISDGRNVRLQKLVVAK